jgi:hypothetical protein
MDNAFNLLEIPGSLNSWMAGIAAREWSFRAGVLGILGMDFAAGYLGTRAVIDKATSPDGGGEQVRRPNETMRSK